MESLIVAICWTAVEKYFIVELFSCFSILSSFLFWKMFQCWTFFAADIPSTIEADSHIFSEQVQNKWGI